MATGGIVYPSGKERRRLQEKLKTIEFVDGKEKLKKFKCNLCKEVALEKHAVDCGHWFCHECIDDIHGRGICPVDKCKKAFKKSSRSNEYEAELYLLIVLCPNHQLGCKVKVPLHEYLEHESECPIAFQKAEASENVIQRMRSEISDLQHTVKRLQEHLIKTEEILKINSAEERGLKIDFQLMERKLDTISSQRIDAQSKKIMEKCEKEFQKVYKEQTSLKAEIDKNFAIQQNQELGLEKKEIERYIQDQITQECARGMQDFHAEVTELVNSIALQQRLELSKGLFDEFIGRLSQKELELEYKLEEKFDTKFKKFLQDFEDKMMAKYNTEMAANKLAFENWLTDKLNIEVGILKKDLKDEFTLFFNRKTRIFKKELSDVMHEEVNDKIDECTRTFRNLFKEDLQVKVADVKQILLKRILEEIKTKTDQHKTSVLNHVMQEMITKVATHRGQLETHFLNFINENMRATESEFCEHFSNQINENLEEQSQELFTRLSNEFNNEMTVLRINLDDQYEAAVQMREDIEALDKSYFAKPDFLLEKYSTEYVWPISNFSQILEQLKTGEITEIESDIFIIKNCQLKMRANLTWRNNDILLMLGFVEEDGCAVYHHRRTAVLIDQRRDVSLRKNRIRVAEPHFGPKLSRKWMNEFCHLGMHLFPPLEEFTDAGHYVRNDTAVIQILIEPLNLLYKSIASKNGTLVWTLKNISKLRVDQKNGVIDKISSEYFYSGNHGYRMQLDVYFCTPFVSLHLNILHGEFDEFLPVKFPHKATFVILDQSDSPNKTHLVKSLESEETDVDFIDKFAKCADILGNSVPNFVAEPVQPLYTKDDSILIKVIVETND